MPYFGIAHLERSVDVLRDQTVSIHLAILCMLQNKVPTSNDPADAVEYGLTQEREFLHKHFAFAGGPPDKPYFVPFGTDQGKERWRAINYPGRTLQKLRTVDYAAFFVHPDKKRFAFKPGYVDLLQQAQLGNKPLKQLQGFPLVYLAVWFFRQREIPSLPGAVDMLVEEFHLDRDGLLDGPFSKQIPAVMNPADLRNEPLSDGEIALLLGIGAPPAAPAFSWTDLHAKVVDALTADKIEVDKALVAGVLDAWLARDIVVLVGAPGTGKSLLARGLVRAVSGIFSASADVVSHEEQVSPEHDVARFLGYENLEGRLVPSEFTRKILLDATRRLAVVPLLLDEWNLARVDEYFAAVLAAVESGQALSLPGQPDAPAVLPVDTLIIATCNSYLDEPDTRSPLSVPVKRRCVIFDMRNLFADHADAHGVEAALNHFADLALAREMNDVQKRFSDGGATTFDHFRRAALQSFAQYANLPVDVRDKLRTVIEVLLGSPTARRNITLGVVRDVVLSIAYAGGAPEMEAALRRQIIGKLMQVLTGDAQVFRNLDQAVQGWPAAEEIRTAIAQYESLAGGSGGRIIPTV